MLQSFISKKFRPIPVIVAALLLFLIYNFVTEHAARLEAEQHKERVKNAIINPAKVFQIGFSKCGTTTLNHFFNKNGVRSVHHDRGKLPSSIHNNFLNGKPLLSKCYEKIFVFTDLDHLYRKPQVQVGMQYYKEFDKQYPGSKFILNTRDKAAWLKSRAKQPIHPSNESLLVISARLHGLSTEEELQQWSLDWDKHHREVLEYFKDRPNDLLVFNIEQDPPAKLVEFFKENFRLDPTYYQKKNSTAFRTLKVLWHQYLGFKTSGILLQSQTKLDP
jgi:hypothetical protein